MTTPILVTTRSDFAAERAQAQGKVAVVMTMGALHEGHATLIRRARAEADFVILTIFLNPLQFSASEDLSRYPQTLEADIALAAREGADLVFAPTPDVVYPDGEPGIRISAGELGSTLEGASRPGHFDGMLTVVNKLLNLTKPEIAFFGQKDAQQLLLIKRMVRDLDMGVEIVGVPTVREKDGLALSSRNTYLSAEDREVALSLSRALKAGESASGQGVDAVRSAAQEEMARQPQARLDYLVLVDPVTLAEISSGYEGEALLALAAKVGTTRLIDNVLVYIGPA